MDTNTSNINTINNNTTNNTTNPPEEGKDKAVAIKQGFSDDNSGRSRGKTSLIERKDVDPSLTWDLTHLFKTEAEYNQAVEEVIALTEKTVATYKGRLTTPNSINQCLGELQKIHEMMSQLRVYTYLAVSVDGNNPIYQTRRAKMIEVMADLNSRLTFINSEILTLAETDQQVIREAIRESKSNKKYLQNLLDHKPYNLHPEAEKLMAALRGVLDTPFNVYQTSKMLDIDFGTITVEDQEIPLTFSSFENKWEAQPITEIRHRAFKQFHTTLDQYKNTFAVAYNNQVIKEKVIGSIRGFKSVFDYLLYNHQIDKGLFDRHIDLVMEKLAPHMQKYAKLIQRVYNLDEMTFADLKVSLDPTYEPKINLEDAKEQLLMGLSPLGDDYLEMITRSFDERWIDFAENIGKDSGAYCYSAYNCHPYISLNWAGSMVQLFILSHELGHAGHYELTHQNQNIFDSKDSPYFVEAPSTLNELLLAQYLLETNKSPRFRRWVLATLISRTYYHNFVTHLLEAAFQREVYKVMEEGGVLQAKTLNDLKHGVLKKFWGDSIKINKGAELTWIRQPHYYMGLYPYTYSAGLTIATEVCKKIQRNRISAINDWRNALKAGGAKTPVELAKLAGVDITTEKPLLNTIQYIGDIIEEIIKLTDEIELGS